MSTDRLRQAANVLRERAEKATPGPWREEYSGKTGPVVLDVESHNALDHVAKCCHYRAGFDAAYIATVHPGVGLALADMLDTVAHHVGTFDCEAHCEPDGCSTVRESDRIADLILGGE